MRPIGPRGKHKGVARRPLMYATLVAAVAIFLLLTLVACGGGQQTTTSAVTSPGPEQTTTTAAAPAGEETTTTAPVEESTTTTSMLEETTTTTLEGETTTTVKLSSAETQLDNGHIKAMGFIKKVWEEGGKRYINIDYAQMLTGEAAVQQAIKDGYIKPGESLDTDYYISNTNPELRKFEVASPVAITTSTWQGEMNKPVTWDVFKSFWSASPPDQDAAYLRDSPWWIERDGAVVVKIDEQYLP